MELQSPYSHTLLITMGGGLKRAGLRNGDEVIVDVLDGLVVNLSKGSASSLSFKREDVILSEDFGEVRKGARVAMGTRTAEMVKILEEDHELCLHGPFGGVTNLDVRPGLNSLLPNSRWVTLSVSVRFNRLRSGFGWLDESALLM